MIPLEKCCFCDELVRPTREELHRRTFYECKHCGRYLITDSAKGRIEREYTGKRHLLAGYLINTKEHRNHDDSLSPEDNAQNILITVERLESILNEPIVPKTVVQKLDNLLVFLHEQNEYIGQIHTIKPGRLNNLHPFAVYAINEDEVYGMLSELGKLDYIDAKKDNAVVSVRILTNGFVRAEQLLSSNTDSKKVFVAMGFKPDLLHVMNTAIRPACMDCGFDAYLISDKEHNNGITDEIIVAIKTSKFVITDFTYNNCGAYFEAGYAQGHGLDVIRCCKKEWFDEIAKDNEGNELVDKDGNKKKANQLHFDVTHYNFIIWEDETDLMNKLKNRIRAIIPGAKMADDEAGE